MPAIETDGLTKRYGDLTAVADLDLTVEAGEAFGFLGPNGAGKSTTIDLLLGFLSPTDGRATVLGHDATDESLAVRRRIGLLPDGVDVYDNLSGRDHVVSAVRTKGADEDPDAVLDRVGLAPDDARRPAGGYSKGMLQRLGLGVALVGDPDLLILDEPSSGLDPSGMELLRQVVREETDRGATVFFSSHLLGQVEQVCDRVGIMDDGRLVTVDAIADLRAEIGTTAAVEATVESVPDLDDVRGLDGVRDVTASGDVVRASCSRPEAKMAALRRLDERTTVRDLDVTEASLEALFDAYTGDSASGGEREASSGSSDDGTTDGQRTAATDGGADR